MAVMLHGLKNCDTTRKAIRWLADAGIEAEFVDVRDDGVDPARLADWIATEGWQTLLNRRSTTWRKLSDSEKENLDAARAGLLLRQYPTLIKRPVLETATGLVVGFSGPRYQAALAGAD